MRVVSTFFHPSSVLHSVKCKLCGTDTEYLVLSKPNQLEVFALLPEGAKLRCSLEIWGVVSSLKVIPHEVSQEVYVDRCATLTISCLRVDRTPCLSQQRRQTPWQCYWNTYPNGKMGKLRCENTITHLSTRHSPGRWKILTARSYIPVGTSQLSPHT